MFLNEVYDDDFSNSRKYTKNAKTQQIHASISKRAKSAITLSVRTTPSIDLYYTHSLYMIRIV